ncbi:calmodulin-binding protein [Musa troglodytarum]|uniref:Calmodulin-binding protein n=1 Tax=Musa troglodytarum TaxID=320322 RepID=A0A9E7EAJ8_9LILI|nr:calmodulin-binding protein [Musa troglodytarum]
MRYLKSRALPSHVNIHRYGSMNDTLEGLIKKSISFRDEVKSKQRSISFDGRDCEAAILQAFGPGNLLIKGSVSFNGRFMETKASVKSPKPTNSANPRSLRCSPLKKRSLESTLVGPDSPKHEAALKLQKVYRSFRTRRQLADCAVLVEQRWWKLLDFALLRLSSVSFFDIEKPESAVSRWSRARTRAAKVGKGLSKDEKAQKLALQHWLEAIDPRHRYGHNLQSYYNCWLQCKSLQPFFYWLDVGEGKEVNIEEQCTRSKLQQQCIKYLGPKEREAFEVVIEDGKLMYRQSRQLLHTSDDGSKDAKWIFVLSTSKNLYVAQKRKGTFQHSSFLAGGATSAAGQLVVVNGDLKAVWPHSGHYRPTEENFREFMSYLEENSVDLTYVKKSPTGEEEDEVCKPETRSFSRTDTSSSEEVNSSSCLSDLKLGGGEEEAKGSIDMQQNCKLHKQTSVDDHEENEEESSNSNERYIFRKKNLFAAEEGEDVGVYVPSELILRRINSKKGIESYQLGKQLSCRWTTGAGPRIGCVRDYPWELQFRALEQVNLSSTSFGTVKCLTPTTKDTTLKKKLQQQPRRPANLRRRNQSL